MLESDLQLANTERKLQSLEEQIAKAHRRPETDERNDSIDALESLARQLKEEIVRYRAGKKLRDAV